MRCRSGEGGGTSWGGEAGSRAASAREADGGSSQEGRSARVRACGGKMNFAVTIWTG